MQRFYSFSGLAQRPKARLTVGKGNIGRIVQTDRQSLSWAIVMTAKEPAALVLANVGWHLSLGAREVHVYLDDPLDPVAEPLRKLDRVRVVLCDDAHWQRLGPDAQNAMQTRRQSLNATEAYKMTEAGWMIHLDADEFLYPQGDMTQIMADAYTMGADFLRVRPWERTYVRRNPEGLFEGAFRIPVSGGEAENWRLFGDISEFLTKGMTGHAAGKSMVQVGQDLRLGIHTPKKKGVQLEGRPLSDLVLLHFDGMTPLHWMMKILRYRLVDAGRIHRMLGGHRQAQVLAGVEACESMTDLLEFHNLLKFTRRRMRIRLEQTGRYSPMEFAPHEAITKALGYMPDLSVEGFDAELRRRHPELLGLLPDRMPA